MQSGSVQLSAAHLRDARYLVIGSLAKANRTVEVQIHPVPQTGPQEGSPAPLPRLQVVTRDVIPASNNHIIEAASVHETAYRPLVQDRLFRFPTASQTSNASLALIPIKARLLSRGTRSQVYLDSRDVTLDLQKKAEQIVLLLDKEIIPRMEKRLGTIADLDGDRRISLLLTSHLRDMTPQENVGAVPLKGLTWSEDFHADSNVGNHADLIYLGVDLPQEQGLRSLLQHELTHAVFFSQNASGDKFTLEDWMSEGIAHLAETWENADSSNWGSRLRTFNNSTGEYPLVVPSYPQAGLWRNPGCRGATFQFLYWCEQCCGPSFSHRLLHTQGTARQRLETATANSFPDLFRQWSCAAILTPERLPAEHSQASERRPRELDCDLRNSQRITLRGTSFRILKLVHQTELPADAGIRIQAPEGSDLQVTLLP